MRTLTCSCLLAVATVATPVAVTSATAAVSKPQWDPGVKAIAKKVEQLRGLRFRHPVPVTYLSPKAFDTKTSPRRKPSKSEKARAVRYAGLLRAFGFVTGTVDPSSFTSSIGVQAAAFYSPQKKRIFIRGHHIDVVTSVIVAHELTHALQDQHFHLMRLERSAVANNGVQALRGLVEGDAKYIEHKYLRQLDQADQHTYTTAVTAIGRKFAPPESAAGLRGLPDLRAAFFGAAYSLGEQMVALIDTTRGRAAVNALFRHPPRSTSAYVTPTTLLSHRRPAHLAAPGLHGDEIPEALPGPLDSLSLFFMLAGRMNPARALTAVDGLSAGEEIDFHRGTLECTRIAVTGHSAQGTAALRQALSTWAAAMPRGAARVTSTPTRVVVTSCDPRKSATLPRHRASFAVGFVTTRNAIVNGALSRGDSVSVAQCVGERVIHTSTVTQYVTATVHGLPSGSELASEVQIQIVGADARCKSSVVP